MRKTSFNYEELLACTRGDIFGANSPKLPAPNMLMFDRISTISESGGRFNKGEVIAELDIKPDLWFFKCHFIGDPVMPGCLGLDALWQLCGFFLAWKGNKGRGRALGVGEVKFTGQVLPHVKHVSYHLHFRRIIDRKLIMAIADGEVFADGELIYEAKGLKAGIFSHDDA